MAEFVAGIDNQTSEMHIRELKKILGHEWCKEQLATYMEFRQKYSPASLWSHRPPETSPIVPLLFQHQYPSNLRGQSQPFGYWYGDPIHMLRQLAASIFMFEDYWSQLPNGIGESNIRYRLSNADFFSGFLFELMVAVDCKLYEYKDYNIEPLFFDPRAVVGSPDIVVRKAGNALTFQCKTRNPVSALDMPFEVCQYIFGYFYRLMQDSGHSYILRLRLKHRIQPDQINGILRLLETAVRCGLEIQRQSKESSYDVELLRVEVPTDGLTLTEINNLRNREKANIFLETGCFNPYEKNATAFSGITVCSISGRQHESLEKSIIDIVSQAARDAIGTNPLVIAVHLYKCVEWEEFLGNQSNRDRLEQSLDSLFEVYPRIKYVNVSSNMQEYDLLPSGAQFLRTQYLKISNKLFAS